MRQTVVGVFDKVEAAQHAAQALQESGFGPEAVQVSESFYEDGGAARDPDEHRGAMASIRSFFAEVFGSGDDPHLGKYAEAVRRGHALVKVDAEDEPKVDAARQVLQDAGAIDIDERAAEWREQGWRGEMDESDFERTYAAGALGPHAAAGSELEPSDASSVGFGERAPVQGSLDLREEHAKVERGSLDRPAGNDDNAAARPARAFDDEADYYRSDWRTQYGAQGGAYEDYEPAYRYGHRLGSDARYAGRLWDELEADARSDWESRHPGSAWERFKAAVRRGWDRVRG
jgi:hypothetical protein